MLICRRQVHTISAQQLHLSTSPLGLYRQLCTDHQDRSHCSTCSADPARARLGVHCHAHEHPQAQLCTQQHAQAQSCTPTSTVMHMNTHNHRHANEHPQPQSCTQPPTVIQACMLRSAPALQQVQVIPLLCITPSLHPHKASTSCQLLHLLLAVLVTELNIDQLSSCNSHRQTASSTGHSTSTRAACVYSTSTSAACSSSWKVHCGIYYCLVVSLMPPQLAVVQAKVVKVLRSQARALAAASSAAGLWPCCIQQSAAVV